MPKLLVLFLLITCSESYAQENFWLTLSEVSFLKTKDANGYEIEKPIFSEKLRSFHQKKIILKGYIIPMNELNGKPLFMLSSLPFNVCYFCGGAGPETVVEVNTEEKIEFTTKLISLEGILILNPSDPDHHIYLLKNPNIVR